MSDTSTIRPPLPLLPTKLQRVEPSERLESVNPTTLRRATSQRSGYNPARTFFAEPLPERVEGEESSTPPTTPRYDWLRMTEAVNQLRAAEPMPMTIVDDALETWYEDQDEDEEEWNDEDE